MFSRSPWLFVALIAIAGIVGLGFATSWGIGVTPDAVIYFDAARHLAAGDGYVAQQGCIAPPRPLTHFPPLYPLTLAVPVRLGLDALAAARVTSVLLLALNVFLVALIARHVVPRSPLAPIAAALIFASSHVILDIHTLALSEPLFLFWSMIGLYSLQLHRERGGTMLLAAASVALAAALLTRYVGISLVITAALLLLCDRRSTLFRRLGDIAVCCGPPVAALSALLLRNRYLTGESTDTTLRWHGLGREHAEALVMSIGSWLVPGSDRFEWLPGQDVVIAALVLAALAALLWWRKVGSEDAEVGRRPVAFEVFALTYPGCLLAFISFIPNIPTDSRLLSPMFAATLVVGVHRFGVIYRRAGRPLRYLATAAVAALAVAYIGGAFAIVAHLHARGRAYSGDSWRFDELRREILNLPPEVRIFSDTPSAVYFSTGRVACHLRTVSGKPRWLEQLGPGPVAIVRFGDRRRFPSRSEYMAPPKEHWSEALEGLDLELVVRDRNATLHRVRRGSPADGMPR
jgi:hypothetical protein